LLFSSLLVVRRAGLMCQQSRQPAQFCKSRSLLRHNKREVFMTPIQEWYRSSCSVWPRMTSPFYDGSDSKSRRGAAGRSYAVEQPHVSDTPLLYNGTSKEVSASRQHKAVAPIGQFQQN
jgi:hypothetical protein